MTTKNKKFIQVNSDNFNYLQCSPNHRMYEQQIFIDNGLSQIGGVIEGVQDQISDSDTLFKIKGWLEHRDRQFQQDNHFNTQSIMQSKKTRSQLLSQQKEQPPSPKSQYSRQEITTEQYQRSADRKCYGKNINSIRDSLPIFKLTQQPIMKKITKKFTPEEYEKYKKLKQLVKSFQCQNKHIISEANEKSQLTDVMNACDRLHYMMSAEKQIIEKVDHFAVLRKHSLKSQQNYSSNNPNKQENPHEDFLNQKMQKIQELTSLLQTKSNQYKKSSNVFQNEKQTLIQKQSKQIQGGFMKKNFFCLQERQNEKIIMRQKKEFQFKSSKQTLNSRMSKQSRNESKQKQRTIIDEYKQKLSLKTGSIQITNNKSEQVEKQYKSRLVKALTPISSKNEIKNSLTMGGISLSEFLQMEKISQLKQQVKKLFQDKKKLQKLVEGFKAISNLQDDQNQLQKAQRTRLLTCKQKPQILDLTKLTQSPIQLSSNPLQLKNLNLLPQKCSILYLIDQPQINKSPSNIKETQIDILISQNSQQDIEIIQFKSIKISNIFPNNVEGTTNKFDNCDEERDILNQLNSQRINNRDYEKPISPTRPHMQMVNSVMLKNNVDQRGSKAIKNSRTFRNNSRSIRQGMSQKFSRSPGRSQHMQNTSAKKQNLFTQLPSLEDELRREAIYQYVSQQGMDPQQYYRQDIDSKIEQYIIRNGGYPSRVETMSNKSKSSYMGKQQRKRLKYQKSLINQLQQQQKHIDDLQQGELQQWQILFMKRNNQPKGKLYSQMTAKFNQNQRQNDIDSSIQDTQHAKRFFKIGQTGTAEQIDNINKSSKKRENKNIKQTLLNESRLKQMLQEEKKNKQYFKKQCLGIHNDDENQSEDINKNSLVIHSRQLNNNHLNSSINKSRQKTALITFNDQQQRISKKKSQSIIIIKTHSDNQDNDDHLAYMNEDLDNKNTYKDDPLPTFGALQTKNNLLQKNQTSQKLNLFIKTKQQQSKQQQKQQSKQKQKGKQQQKQKQKQSKNIFAQFSNKNKVNLFTPSLPPKPSTPQSNAVINNQLTKHTSLQQRTNKNTINPLVSKQKQQPATKTQVTNQNKKDENKSGVTNIFGVNKSINILKTGTGVNSIAGKQQQQKLQQQQKQLQQQQRKLKQQEEKLKLSQQQPKPKQSQLQQQQPKLQQQGSSPLKSSKQSTQRANKHIFGKPSNIFSTSIQKKSNSIKLANTPPNAIDSNLQSNNVSNNQPQQNNNVQQQSATLPPPPPQFTSFNPQQFQNAFKPKQNSMTFANFQSQNNQNNNDGNNVMKQIGQHIQHLFQPQQNMGTFESFGPTAFGSPSSMQVNQSLQSSQNNQQQQESKNIFNQQNIFASSSNQQQQPQNNRGNIFFPGGIPSTNQQQQQQGNIFSGANNNPMNVLQQSMNNNNNQGNIFNNQQQQNSNNNNIFGGSNNNNNNGNIFSSMNNNNSSHNIFGINSSNKPSNSNNIFGMNNIFNKQPSQQIPNNIPPSYMQPRK